MEYYEYHNGILCVSGTNLIISDANPQGVMSLSYYTNLVSARRINRVRRATRETSALVEFDSLPSKYKAMYEAQHPDPRKAAALAPFAMRIKADTKAYDYFSTYTYGEYQTLPSARIEQYCNDAAIFNALDVVVDQMEARRSTFPRSVIEKFGKKTWDYALECVDSVRKKMPCNMPTNPRVLRRKFEKYMQDGYVSLVHSGYGNKNRDAIKDDVAEAVLLALFRDGRKFSDAQVARSFNKWAAEVGHAEVSERMVTEFRHKNLERITMQRDGRAAWDNRYNEVTKRHRPTAPLMLINSDDNDLDLYYKHTVRIQTKEGKIRTQTSHYFRYKIYVVLDAHCDYILGYAVGEQITVELIREAYRNAMNHVRELTGAYHLWGQIVADRWGIGKEGGLRAFFENQAAFTPPEATKARGKIIESSFGSVWHNMLKCNFSNYAGNNITAKNKINPDRITEQKTNFPTTGAEAMNQIAQFIEIMRTSEWKKSGKTRREVWLASFNALNVSDERRISEQTYLGTFGERNERPVRISNEGIKTTIGGVERVYEVPDSIYRKVIGEQVKVQYDPLDLSRILVSNDKNIRFVAHTNVTSPMALDDMKEGDRIRLNERLERKKRRIAEVIDEAAFHESELARLGIDINSYLQSGDKRKESTFAATAVASIPMGETDERKSIYQYMRS